MSESVKLLVYSIKLKGDRFEKKCAGVYLAHFFDARQSFHLRFCVF